MFSGILYSLLHVRLDILQQAIPGAQALIIGTLNYILTWESDEHGVPAQSGFYPTRMERASSDKDPLVHWCHGSPGAIFLFSRAHKVFGKPEYVHAAERAGEAVWQKGLLRKGPGACHGVSGNAEALLQLYRLTEEGKWLHRAARFAEFMGTKEFSDGAHTPDHPYSLYEGWAGAVCLYADLLNPKGAGFPVFGVID